MTQFIPQFVAWLSGDEASLGALFLASFLAATVLPGGSEVMLFAVLGLHPERLWLALGLATLGNAMGGMTSYLLGRFLPQDRNHRAAGWLQRHGSPVLLLAWAPLIGDALCVAAGWLRINAWHAALFMLIGKAARYGAVTLVAA